ncbi:MAG: hypothetical protein COC01_07885 [Bacteroidetes bacterium]|nr:MAG: hypothetical protein COC01_07885 [Bacteroidota bacterium]
MKSFNCLVLTFLISLISFHNSFSQNQSEIDSLENVLSHSNEDTNKINLLNLLAWKLCSNDFKAALSYANEANKLSSKLAYNRGLISSYNNMGLVYDYKGDFSNSLLYYDKYLKLSEKLGRKYGVASAYNNMASVYLSKGDFPQSLSYFLKATELYEELNNKKGMSITYNNIGLIYSEQGKYDKAIAYYNKANTIKEGINDIEGRAIGLINLAVIYYNKGDFVKALDYTKQSLELQINSNDKEGMAKSYSNLGEIYITLDSISRASKCLDNALTIYLEIDNKIGEASTLNSLGFLYEKKGEFSKAIEYMEASIRIAKDIGMKKDLQNYYKSLSYIYASIQKYGNAYKYHQIYSSIKDSVFNESSAKSMNEMQAKYESEKKEKEIDILSRDNELKALQTLQQENQIKKQWYWIIGNAFILGLLIALIYVVYSQLKFKRLTNKELELTNDQLEHINTELEKKDKNISESINYAQRIQETIMPTQKQLQAAFPESFIFYKAKDVVSGDFPWVMHNENVFFAAAVDCTGHGVPGAMMSMIGYFLLNDIIGGRKMKDPAIILDQLHQGIKRTLKQEENLESKDGMDIALCAINREKHELHYAGAHRSLLLLHNNEIEEIRGDRFPVGGLQYSSRGKEIKFKNHKLQLEEGDSIYFYSDGLIDQIGGPKGRRFQNNQVKEIIIENKSKPMYEIKDVFNDRFNKWMGNEKQLDDVIMMGIRV